MTETSEALSEQTKKLKIKKFGDQEAIIEGGFYDDDNPIQEEKGSWSSYITEKLIGAKETIDKFKGYVENFDMKLDDKPEEGSISAMLEEVREEIKTKSKLENVPTENVEIKTEVTKKEEPIIDYDTNWYKSDDLINKLKSASYIEQYAQGEVGQEKGFQLALGYRTNNWLSQHQLGQKWEGRSKIKNDKIIIPGHDKETHNIMEVFDTPEFGVRAAMVDVMTKALKPASLFEEDTITFKEGKDGSSMITLQRLIDSKYMKDPTPYLRLAKQKGYGLNDKFNLFNKSEAMEWYTYMLQAEMGSFSYDIPQQEKDKVFNSAYSMAMDRMRNEEYTYYDTAKKYLDSSQ